MVNAVAFTLLYRWLPKRSALAACLPGAAIVAIGWEVGRRVLESVLIGTRSTRAAYGIVGRFHQRARVWCYYGCMLILFGVGSSRTNAGPADELRSAGGLSRQSSPLDAFASRRRV